MSEERERLLENSKGEASATSRSDTPVTHSTAPGSEGGPVFFVPLESYLQQRDLIAYQRRIIARLSAPSPIMDRVVTFAACVYIGWVIGGLITDLVSRSKS